MLTFSERIWRGSREKRRDLVANLPAKGTKAWEAFNEFEDRLIYHRDRYFKSIPFAYVKQSEMKWRLIGPFNHHGINDTSFEPEKVIKEKYIVRKEIFCTVGEEEGFVGSTAVLLLFLILILRLIVVAERQQSPFGRVYGYSVLSIFLFHLFINIGMVLGLTPVIGIPLPFFSYGGSSLWGFTILLFIFLRIDAGRNRRI